MASIILHHPATARLAVSRILPPFLSSKLAFNEKSPKRAYGRYVDSGRIVGPGAFQQPAFDSGSALSPTNARSSGSPYSTQDTNNLSSARNGIEHVHDPKHSRHIPAIDVYVLSEFSRLMASTHVSDMRTAAGTNDGGMDQPQKKDDFSTMVPPSLGHLLAEYDANAQRILKSVLPGESLPSPERRLWFGGDSSPSEGTPTGSGEGEDGPVVLVAHIAVNEKERSQKISMCSGFFIDSRRSASDTSEVGDPNVESKPILVSCAHTLEEVCSNSLTFRLEFLKTWSISLAFLWATNCEKRLTRCGTINCTHIQLRGLLPSS